MRKLSAVLLIGTLALLGGFAGGKFSARAQITTFNVQVATGTSESNCTVVTAATTFCFTGGGIIYVSINGAAYVPYTSGTTIAGVSSISVNGGTALTGPVALTIPTTATTTVTSTASTTIH